MPLTPTATRELLAKLSHRPKRSLGQNFLIDGNIVRKSLALAEVAANDVVVEVGPGLGTLTSALLETGAEVWAVERDSVLAAHLRTELAPRFLGRFHLMEGDAVEHPLAGLEKLFAGCPRPANQKRGEGTAPTVDAFKIVANLPYAISTPWMDTVLSGPLPARMVLMLQKEAAQRYAAVPGTKQFGAISIFLQAAYDSTPAHRVSAACFYPHPEVDSLLLKLVRRAQPHVFSVETRALIRTLFQQRRKQLGSLLRGLPPDRGTAWLARLEARSISSQARPEEIPVAAWMELSPLMSVTPASLNFIPKKTTRVFSIDERA
ncbi:MAG: ribosomal RNA small subunit methyltransferase A [Verrucomicrobiota bacterium]|nr:ribosomal RNA small subunit methyltransferase A [Verrucomicrobiota bacterium]